MTRVNPGVKARPRAAVVHRVMVILVVVGVMIVRVAVVILVVVGVMIVRVAVVILVVVGVMIVRVAVVILVVVEAVAMGGAKQTNAAVVAGVCAAMDAKRLPRPVQRVGVGWHAVEQPAYMKTSR